MWGLKKSKASPTVPEVRTLFCCITQPLKLFLLFLQESYNVKRERRESLLIYNKKQEEEGKHGLAENSKPRFSLPPSPNFFSLQEVPREKDSLNSRYFSKTLLEQSLVYPIWQCKV